MKVMQLINQNIPIWSLLCGDHAVANDIKMLNPKLLEEPDFLSALENQLRLDVFKHKRDWIYAYMKDKASFGVVQFEIAEIEDMNTCFSEISMKKFVDEYENAINNNTGFTFNRKYTRAIEKDLGSVKGVKELSLTLEKAFTGKITPEDVCNLDIRNEVDLFVAANRGWVTKGKDGKLKIIDGTHRLLAYCLSRRSGNVLPKKLYCFYFEEV